MMKHEIHKWWDTQEVNNHWQKEKSSESQMTAKVQDDLSKIIEALYSNPNEDYWYAYRKEGRNY